MALLHAGENTSVIALWMGHEDPASTQAYLHADMTIKEKALTRVRPLDDRVAGRGAGQVALWAVAMLAVAVVLC